MAWYVFKVLSQLRGSGAFWNEGGGGAHLSLSPTPTQIFQNALCIVHWHNQTSLQSSQCQVCLQSIYDNATVGSCSGCPASWCFLGSSWVIWGHTMCALMSLMPLVMSLMIFLTPTCGGRGGETVPQAIFVLEGWGLLPKTLIYRCFAPSEFPHLYHWSLYSYASAREVFETTHTLFLFSTMTLHNLHKLIHGLL